MSSSSSPAAATACSVASDSLATAILKVSCPAILISWSSRGTWMIRSVSASLPRMIGPIRLSPVADQHDRAGAVGEHGRRAPVARIDDPRHQVRADHDDACRAARIDHRGASGQRGQEAGAGRADVERAGACGADRCGDQRRRRSACTSSGVVVATRTMSTSAASTPARSSARLAAIAAWVSSRSCGAATCRLRIPVRRSIQSGARPRRASISAESTVPSGTLAPTETAAAPPIPRSDNTGFERVVGLIVAVTRLEHSR